MIDIVPILLFVIAVLILLPASVKLNKEWEETVILRLGKFSRVKGAGPYLVVPFLDTRFKRDRRVQTLDVREQRVITRDNVPVQLDAVMWCKIVDSAKSVLRITDYEYSVRQLAMTALRNVVGQKNLDETLSEREVIASTIEGIVDKASSEWGVDIERVELQNIVLPESMERVMARQAEAEREKRAVIISAEGELQAAKNLREASNILEQSKFGFLLRQLTTISDVSQDESNTIIFVPTEALNSSFIAAGVSARTPPPKGQQTPSQSTREEVKG